ncbi:MAG: ribosome silencing factor [Bacteroidales bacterium]|nr:ribosome silencing factor [Bacteroidales bacterium]
MAKKVVKKNNKGVKRLKEKKDILKLITEAAEEKKAENILTLDLRKFENRICDYFVICSGKNRIHIETIVDHIKQKIKTEINENPHHIEGLQNAYWVILDYIRVVIHVMQNSAREYYRLEDLWKDAKVIEYERK